MAFLTHDSILYFSPDPIHPVGTLLEGIWTQYPDRARAITRSRIFSRQPLTPLCEGMLLVVGKRHSQLSPEEYDAEFQERSKILEKRPIFQSELTSISSEMNINRDPLSPKDAMVLAHCFALKSERRIGAVLLDQNMKFVAGGWNQHHQNRVLHAEIMMIKNFQSFGSFKKIPKNYSVFSTLQPCAMCAGYLYQYSESFDSLNIVFEKVDPGPFAQNSVWVKNSPLWKKVYL